MRVQHRPISALVFACLLAAVAAAAQQRNQEPPVFRGGVTLIHVDVYPRLNGRVVEGLRPEDFQIFEDGKPQEIEAFEFIRIQPNVPDAERRDPNTKKDGDEQAADPRNRVFVVYLDLYHTSFAGAREARRPLLDFLNRVIGATDLFGVLTPEVPVQQLVFGRRTDTLAAEMARYSYFDWGLADRTSIVPRTPVEEQLYALCAAGPQLIQVHREDAFMSSLEELMVRLSVLRDERKNVLLVSEGWIPLRPAPLQMQGTLEAPSLPPIGVTPGGRLGDTTMIGGNNRAFCSREISRLSGIDFLQRFRDLLTAAQRANVSFHPLDVGGLKTFAPTAAMRGVPNMPAMRAAGQSRLNTLITLAENTDGRAIVNSNDIAAGFRRIADDLSAYYLLGYASTNQAADGKFRRIEVKVSRPKISVTARRGYLGPSPAPAVMAPAPERAAAVPSPIAQALGRLSRIRPDVDLFGYAARTPDGFDLVAEISSPALMGGGWNKGADVRVAISQGAAEPIVSTTRIEPGARSAVVHLPLDAGARSPRSAAVSVSGADGSLETVVELPADAAALFGDPICFRGASSARVPLRPVADFQFRRTERLRLEWAVLKPIDRRAARVLDRRGQPLAIAATLTQPSDATLAMDLTLAPLAASDYVVELTVGHGEDTETQLVAFRVVR